MRIIFKRGKEEITLKADTDKDMATISAYIENPSWVPYLEKDGDIKQINKAYIMKNILGLEEY